MKVLAIIPARYGSTRFPGKPLADLAGKPMIQHVYEQVKSCGSISEVVVATDHQEILHKVENFGGKAVMTSENCLSGTDRCAEVLKSLPSEYDLILNVQGDEPFIQCEQLKELIESMNSPASEIGTLIRKIDNIEDVFNPNVVKAVVAESGRALYFSRNPVPFVRAAEKENWLSQTVFYRHIGLYAYRPEVLLKITELPTSKLELAESLEQLRWMEAGFSVYTRESLYNSIGIDTPEDLLKAKKHLADLS
jgi:3-deoxy-manno-octulosonate cytidylyltransferase (CMP-KDO synthetase)